MEYTIFIALIVFVARVLMREFRGNANGITTVLSDARTSLCTTCAYAHIACGYRDRDELIACTYAGVVRAVEFAVSDCTMYCNRNANTSLVRISGFAKPIEATDAIAAEAEQNPRV